MSTGEKAMARQRGRFDLFLDAIGARHSVEPCMTALAMDGTLCPIDMAAARRP
ncbi:hypothetical protein AB0N67_30055 [Streptomyces microflavus]|uniref:hypothetical protein n=1 Tax=Streptomyces microflavus TaxID=1919 RepID=UPI00342AEC15